MKEEKMSLKVASLMTKKTGAEKIRPFANSRGHESPMRQSQKKFKTLEECQKAFQALEEEHHETQSRAEGILQAMPDLMFYLSRDGVFLDYKAEVHDLYTKPQMFLGKKIQNVLPKQLAEQTLKAIKKAEKTRQLEVFEYELEMKGGKKIYEARVTCCNEYGGALVIARDVTEQKAFEEKIIQANERFDQVAANAMEWFWEVDEKGLYTYVSPVVEEVMGYRPDELIGKKHFFDLFHPKDKAALKKGALQAFVKKLSFKDFENRNLHKSGKTIWLSTSGVPILDKQGKMVGYRGADTDITDRKRAEQDLFSQTENLEVTLQSIGDGVISTDKGGLVMFMNAVAEAMTGCKEKEAKGKKITQVFKIVNERTKKPRVNPIFKAMKKGEVKELANHTMLISKDGKKRIISDSAAPITNKEGKVIGGILVFRDDTERRHSEDLVRTSEKRYRGLFDRMEEAVAVYEAVENGKDFIFKDFNRAAEKTEGVKRADLLGKKVTKVFPGVKPFGLLKIFQEVWKTGRPRRHPISIYKDERVMGWRENYVYKLPTGEVVAVYQDKTREMQDKQLLKEREEKYRAIFNSTTDMMIVQDIEKGAVLDVNKATIKKTGYSKKELLKMGVVGFSPKGKDYAPEKILKLIKLAAAGQTQSFEWGFMDKKGNLHQTEVDLIRIKLDDTHRLLAVARDITDKKKAEKQLAESEESYRVLVENSGVFVQTIRKDGTYAFVNKSWKKALGYTKAEIEKLNIFEVIAPENKKVCKQHFLDVMSGKEVKGFETAFLTKKGKRLYVRGELNPSWKNGEIVGVNSMCLNITKEKEVQQALVQSEERYRSIYQAVSGVVVSLDPKGGVIDVNDRVKKITGYDKKEFVGKNIRSLARIFPKKSIAIILKNFALRTAGKTVPPYEVEAHHKNGKALYFEIMAERMCNEQGACTGEVAVLHDVTDRHHARMVTQQAKERLEEAVDERTKELRETQGKLVEQEKLAALGMMSSAVAHELRNPMAVVRLATYSLKKKFPEKDAKTLDHFRRIEKSIFDADQIIHDLLLFAKKSEFQPKVNSLHSCINTSLETIEMLIEDMDVQIKKDLQKNPPEIYADFGQLVEVFNNIFTNAIQSTEGRRMRQVTIKTRFTKEEAIITVTDTGKGIKKKDIAHLGEPFFSTKTKGIGLGLHLAYEIVKRHKGSVEVQSEVGKGTTFTISLPLKQS